MAAPPVPQRPPEALIHALMQQFAYPCRPTSTNSPLANVSAAKPVAMADGPTLENSHGGDCATLDQGYCCVPLPVVDDHCYSCKLRSGSLVETANSVVDGESILTLPRKKMPQHTKRSPATVKLAKEMRSSFHVAVQFLFSHDKQNEHGTKKMRRSAPKSRLHSSRARVYSDTCLPLRSSRIITVPKEDGHVHKRTVVTKKKHHGFEGSHSLRSTGRSFSFPERISCLSDGSSSFETRQSNSNNVSGEDCSSDESDEDFAAESRRSNYSTIERKDKYFRVAVEVVATEKKYIDDLELLLVAFPLFMEEAQRNYGSVFMDESLVQSLNKTLQSVLVTHKALFQDLDSCMNHLLQCDIEGLPVKFSISTVLKKYAPFIKACQPFLESKPSLVSLLQECRRVPQFEKTLTQFELERCKGLKLSSYLDVVHQRVCRYPLLLTAYIGSLPKECEEASRAKEALCALKKVAMDVEKGLAEGDNTKKLLEIQRRLVGKFEVIQPGRVFLKEGVVLKYSRKETQTRVLFLFSDVLIYTAPLAPMAPVWYQLTVRNVIPLSEIDQVEANPHEAFSSEFVIRAKMRSFTIIARNGPSERKDWVVALSDAMNKCTTSVLRQPSVTELKIPVSENASIATHNSNLGKVAPVWIPDSRVTMCQNCQEPFTLLLRRHHCRCCGKVICRYCLGYAPIEYKSFEAHKVCPMCYNFLWMAFSALSSGEDCESLVFNYRRSALLNKFRLPSRSYRDRTDLLLQEKEPIINSGFLYWRSNDKWKRCWIVLRPDALLEIYAAENDKVPLKKLILLNSKVESADTDSRGLTFRVTHQNQFSTANDASLYYLFRAETAESFNKWLLVIKSACILPET